MAKDQKARQGKRILLFLDGTWNDDDRDDAALTNIVRMRDLFASVLRQAAAAEKPAEDVDQAQSYQIGGRKYYVYYDRGVGTGAWLDALKGGAFGAGLSRNVRQAYKFLSFYYEPGDEIYIFGFSRGAYTARTLCGYVYAAGLLRRETCTPDNEAAAWAHYRTPVGDRLPGKWTALQPFMQPDRVRIRCLGVFDTVGALGIPLEGFRRWNRARTEFHDVTLNPSVDFSLHALAIDETRMPFQAAVWRAPKFRRYPDDAVEQVWFPGAHGDVGGGCVDHLAAPWQRQSGHGLALDDLTLDWMVRRLEARGGLGDLSPWFEAWRTRGGFTQEARVRACAAAQVQPRRLFYRVEPTAVRALANRRHPVGLRQALVGTSKHETTLGERVHIAALERLGRRVTIGGAERIYAPANLLAALPLIFASYGLDVWPAPETLLPVIGWDGEPMRPGLPEAEDLAEHLLAARARLIATGHRKALEQADAAYRAGL